MDYKGLFLSEQLPPKHCNECGREIVFTLETSPSYHKRLYCSIKCKRTNWNRKEKSGDHIEQPEIKKCVICGDDIPFNEKTKSIYYRAVTCGKSDCQRLRMAESSRKGWDRIKNEEKTKERKRQYWKSETYKKRRNEREFLRKYGLSCSYEEAKKIVNERRNKAKEEKREIRLQSYRKSYRKSNIEKAKNKGVHPSYYEIKTLKIEGFYGADEIRKGKQLSDYYRGARKVENRLYSSLKRRARKMILGEYAKGPSKSVMELVGCDMKTIRDHLENQFKEGMSWDNYGPKGWHIDHIVPLSWFNLTDPDQQKKAFNYTNLQPLWAIDNIKKGNKYIG